jgi:hypothetical protein
MKIIDFTGGLGAQILSYIYYDYSKSKETTYSLTGRGSRKRIYSNSVEDNSWKLDEYYGISMNSLAEFPFPFMVKIICKLMSLLKAESIYRFTSISNVNDSRRMQSLYNALKEKNYSEVLPIREAIRRGANEIIGGEYAAIHVRRGSYIESHRNLINFELFYEAIDSIPREIRKIIIISDSILEESFIINIKKKNYEVIAYYAGDVEISHALIRLSKFIIASNSTFSLTAGILSETSKNILFPLKDFDGLSNSSKVGILKLSKWIVI